jgi:hypothetical protein
VKTTTAEIYEWGRRAASFPLAGKGSEAITPYPFALTARDRTTAYVRQASAAADQKDCRHVGIDGLRDREARAKAERIAGREGWLDHGMPVAGTPDRARAQDNPGPRAVIATLM